MDQEKQIRWIFEYCRGLLSTDGAAQVEHYLEHGEHEMAFEGMVLELINSHIEPLALPFDEWEALAKSMGLQEESIFDGDFWSKFVQWGHAKSV